MHERSHTVVVSISDGVECVLGTMRRMLASPLIDLGSCCFCTARCSCRFLRCCCCCCSEGKGPEATRSSSEVWQRYRERQRDIEKSRGRGGDLRNCCGAHLLFFCLLCYSDYERRTRARPTNERTNQQPAAVIHHDSSQLLVALLLLLVIRGNHTQHHQHTSTLRLLCCCNQMQ